MGGRKLVLVTGATGYIGGRLVPRLLAAGCDVRVFVRSPAKLQAVPWRGQVDIAEGDLGDAGAVARACAGVDTFYYLVHSMGSGPGFEAAELAMARTVAAGAAPPGGRRIGFVGGLHPGNVELSRHMRSRAAVGRVLLEGEVPAVVFQAGVVIGSGSASFEMIRHLAENLPLMPAPEWVRRRSEPIAVRDVLYYLLPALRLPEGLNRTFDIGSREVLTYGSLLYGYAHEAQLPQRRIYALPVPAPRLAGWWVALTTP
ncbi:NAD(P)H-binding protein, partial [Arthrobacter deserti]|nr:NAD(P)H-binding protein [Arthrobacter deserti]